MLFSAQYFGCFVQMSERAIGQGKAPFARQLPQADVVRLRAGGVLPGRAKAAGWVGPHLRAHVAVQTQGGLRLALREDLLYKGMLAQGSGHSGRVVSCHHEVEVTHRIPTAAQATRRLDARHTRHAQQIGPQAIHQRPGDLQRQPVGAAPECLNAGQDVRFGARAHALQFPKAAFPGSGFQFFQRGDAQFAPDQADLFRSQPGYLQPLAQGWWHFSLETFEKFEFSGAQVFVNLGSNRFADAGNTGQFPGLPEGFNIGIQFRQSLRCAAVGHDLVYHLAADIQQVGDGLKHFGKFVIFHLDKSGDLLYCNCTERDLSGSRGGTKCGNSTIWLSMIDVLFATRTVLRGRRANRGILFWRGTVPIAVRHAGRCRARIRIP